MTKIWNALLLIACLVPTASRAGDELAYVVQFPFNDALAEREHENPFPVLKIRNECRDVVEAVNLDFEDRLKDAREERARSTSVAQRTLAFAVASRQLVTSSLGAERLIRYFDHKLDTGATEAIGDRISRLLFPWNDCMLNDSGSCAMPACDRLYIFRDWSRVGVLNFHGSYHPRTGRFGGACKNAVGDLYLSKLEVSLDPRVSPPRLGEILDHMAPELPRPEEKIKSLIERLPVKCYADDYGSRGLEELKVHPERVKRVEFVVSGMAIADASRKDAPLASTALSGGAPVYSGTRQAQ